jgi:tape measure domain-containing protein
MAEYNINFSTNASKAAREISRVNKELTAVIEVGKSIKLNLDTSSLSRSINVTFKTLNKEIDKIQTRLSKLQVGGGAFRSTAAALGYREGQRERGELIAQPLRLRGQAQSFEQGSNVRLQKELRALQIEASQVAPNTIDWVKFQQEIAKINLQLQRADKLADNIQLRENLGAFAPNSLARMEAKLTILRNKAREIAPDDRQWKQINKEIQQLDKGIAKVNKKPMTMGQRAGAAGGAYLYGGGMGGGAGSALGGIAGGLAGGVPGAFAGAAIGQVADNLGTALAGITSQASALQKMQRGLAMASVDAKDFAEAQAAVGAMSQKLLMPLEQTTKYFAQLRANTKEYNLSVADTKEILEGTVLAIMATGGSAEDLDGAMRAVVQIMSKGGVQAEELRGQLGERFPGAVVKFAQANKMSFEELQAGLEAGTIGIREFINFAKKNYTDYAKFSEQLATAPEYAGQRLKMALEQISLEVGSLFGPVGADIQDVLTETINGIAQFIKDNRAYLRQMISDFSSIVGPIAKIFMQLMKVIASFSIQVGTIFQSLFSSIRQSLGMANLGEAKARLDRATKPAAGASKSSRNRPGGGGASREYSQALAAYQALGGDAAWTKANAPAQPSNLTFGGAGAGMSIDRAARGGAKAKKAKELQDYIRNEQDFMRQLAQIAQNRLEITMGLSNEELNILKSQAEFRASNAINEQQYLEDQRNAAEYSVATRDQYLKDIKERYDNEKTLIQQQFDQSVYAPFLALERQLIGENEDLAASLDALKQGRLELTVEERIGLQVSKELRALEAAGLAITPEIIQSIKDKAKAQDALNQSLSYGKTMLALQNQLDLARILDPRAERRAQIRQETPRLSDAQVESQAVLEEQVAAAAKSRDQLRSIASSIGDSFGEAFKGIITGSMTAQEALAGMFQRIADSFADMAAQMIADYMRMQALGLLNTIFSALAPALGAGLSSGFSAGTSSAIDTGAGGWASAFSTPLKFANGGIAPGSFQAFANGGMVTGPTLGLVGEGRYNEAIIPLPDGKSVPVQLSGGAGGNAAPISTSIVVNVKNGQAESQMSGNQGNQLARELEGAVRQVILKESRPGGLISSSR